MRAFITTRPGEVRAALSRFANGDEVTLAACVRVVAVNQAWDCCMELVSRTPSQYGAGVARCVGGIKQRWHLVPTRSAFELQAISNGKCLELSEASQDDGTPCGRLRGADPQLFSLTVARQDTQVVAKHSGKCICTQVGTR